MHGRGHRGSTTGAPAALTPTCWIPGARSRGSARHAIQLARPRPRATQGGCDRTAGLRRDMSRCLAPGHGLAGQVGAPGSLSSDLAAGARCRARRSSAWSFASPSGSATRPSVTIGLFQWPPPAASVATSFPLAGPVDAAARRRPGRRPRAARPRPPGSCRAFPFRQTEWSRPAAAAPTPASPPPSAAISHLRFPLRHTAGAVKRSVPDGVETTCSSLPRCGLVPRSRASERSRIFPSLPPCAIELRREVDGRGRAEVEIASGSAAPCSSACSCRAASPFGESRSTASPQSVRPFHGALPVATRRSPLPGTTTAPARPQIAESLDGHDDGTISPCRSEQSEFQTCSSRPLAGARITTCPWYGGASPT